MVIVGVVMVGAVAGMSMWKVWGRGDMKLQTVMGLAILGLGIAFSICLLLDIPLINPIDVMGIWLKPIYEPLSNFMKGGA